MENTKLTKLNSEFHVLDTGSILEDKKGVCVIPSYQRIDQIKDDGSVSSSSYHVVLTKLKRNNMGLQVGDSKSLFFPVELKKKVIDSLLKLDTEKK